MVRELLIIGAHIERSGLHRREKVLHEQQIFCVVQVSIIFPLLLHAPLWIRVARLVQGRYASAQQLLEQLRRVISLPKAHVRIPVVVIVFLLLFFSLLAAGVLTVSLTPGLGIVDYCNFAVRMNGF